VRLTRESAQAATGTDDDVPDGRGGGIGQRTRLVLASVVLTCIVVGGIVLATRDSPSPLDRAQVGTIASDAVAQAIKAQKAAPATSAVVYQQILPSLVTIESKGPSTKAGSEELGAGVIVNTSGSILTAFHVVDGATSIRATFMDGTTTTAEIASTDPANDIAVLTPKRNPSVIVPAVLGGGDQVGDETFAVGNPLGLIASLSAGVISGLDRSIKIADGKTLRGLIQFDAAVNPGNSGGPLLNRAGQVIGIVTALANPSRDKSFIGIGFAVPIGTAGGAAHAPAK
jgi:Trypsin-like serine proteases, typically periplasmic, contain C-terminal PDZ domain